MITVSVLSAVVVVLAMLGYRSLRRASRKRRFAGLELRPNCLMTRYPIVFVAGRRTLFKPFDQWNDVPLYLREHGYEVAVIESPTRTWNASAVSKAVEAFGQPCHLIGDRVSEAALEEVAVIPGLKIQSITLVNSSDAQPPKKSARALLDDLKPRRSVVETFAVAEMGLSSGFLNPSSWKLEERFLDLAISLAERDAQWSD
ncbi:MAG: hypothetical protein V4692_16710 [Bdellovibrionota bacterium]